MRAGRRKTSEIDIGSNGIRIEMNMCVIDPRNYQTSGQVNALCFRAGTGREFLACADSKNPCSFDGDSLDVRTRFRAGEHAAVDQHHVWDFLRMYYPGCYDDEVNA